MPTYEYVCLSCARRRDVLHGINAPGPTTCELCGGTLRKVISAAAVVFKGSGWAKKDAARAASRPSPADGKTDGTAADPAGSKDVAPSPAAAGPGAEPSARTESRSDGEGKTGSPEKPSKTASGGAGAATAAQGSSRKGPPSPGSGD